MIKVQFEGGAELEKALAGLSTRLSKQLLRESLIEGGEPMRKSIAAKASRSDESPHLGDNMAIGAVRDSDNLASVGIGPNHKRFFYDTMLEFGTVDTAAEPFYRPGMDETWLRTLGIISDALWRELAGKGIQRPMGFADVPVSGEEV